jgi:hypothetical protein
VEVGDERHDQRFWSILEQAMVGRKLPGSLLMRSGSRGVPPGILKGSFTYCLIRAGRSPRSVQFSLGGEALRASLMDGC